MSVSKSNGSFTYDLAPRERTSSVDSEKLSVSSSSVPEQRQRGFSISEMLGRRTSIEDAYKRYAGFTTNGGGLSITVLMDKAIQLRSTTKATSFLEGSFAHFSFIAAERFMFDMATDLIVDDGHAKNKLAPAGFVCVCFLGYFCNEDLQTANCAAGQLLGPLTLFPPHPGLKFQSFASLYPKLVSAATEEPKERRSSLSQMLGRRTSIEDAYKRYAGYTVNGGKYLGDTTKHIFIIVANVFASVAPLAKKT
ncbi:unnamed protein product [Toxocara canis]|uniref:Uncharacterized protein n=1 Tax=Toxocara canis TaxID=6265 RepID=A0A3P7H1E5_TOXCA|nr:unnamed protein product [Toxocara canis]